MTSFNTPPSGQNAHALQWASWLSCQADALPGRLRSDLGASLSEEAFSRLLEFVHEYRRNGAGWSRQGMRGDQLRNSMLGIRDQVPVLFALICEKIALAEKSKWVGGSLDEAILKQQTRYQKFAVASTPRAGTHLLRTMLGSHPSIEMHGEAFNRFGQHLLPYSTHDATIQTILERHLFRPYFEYVEAVGFVLFRDLDEHWGEDDVWSALAKIPDLKVILLDRTNRLERFVSLQKSLRDHVWYVGKNDSRVMPDSRLAVSCDELTEFIDHDLENRAQFCTRFRECNIFPVAYEDLLKDPDAMAAALLEFLGVSPARLLVGTGKKEQRPIGTIVSNFDEIKSRLSHTEYAHYI
ncbi:sulfotransferase [Ralstonia solanacearum]|uniref:sulfotransferase n=1 Tax=Ralstonia solanacearum TaxID=305 RepID=UPI0001D96961|nr:sulfotransferase [Ralstonia solanacearum]CBJ35891.1 conserved hypothethical protein, P-loop containing nucleoside triphosphate hydrolases domain [Ralstonia solanacearum PSI07]